MDSGLHVLDSSLCQWNSGVWFPIVSGIPDSLSWIPDYKDQIPDSTSKKIPDPGFHEQKFPDS